MISYQEMKSAFLKAANENGFNYESAISSIKDLLNTAPNAANFQLAIDTLHFDAWEGILKQPPISVAEQDRIALKYSKFGEHQEAEIQKQIESAQEWKEALEECEISPIQALRISRQEAKFIATEEEAKNAIASDPSPISIPIEIVRLYRDFYRAERRYKPEKTSALKPLLVACEVIRSSSSKGLDLELEVTGRLVALMRQIRAGTARGRWVISDVSKEHHAIKKFASFLVHQVLGKRFNGDKSAFSSKNGIGLIEDACLYLYILEAEKE